MKKIKLFLLLLLALEINVANAQTVGWAWAIGCGGTPTGIATDLDGDIYIAGNFAGSTVTFGNFTLTNANNNSSTDIFVVKYDSNGNVIWAKSAGGEESDYVNSICADNNGNIFLTGSFQSDTISFGNITLNYTNSSQKAYIAKYDGTGNDLWVKVSVSPVGLWSNGKSIATDGNGNVLVTGHYAGFLYFDNNQLLWCSGCENIFIIKFDNDGNYIWSAAAGGPSSLKSSESICTNLNGDVYVTGYYGPESMNIANVTLTAPTGGVYGFFIAKFDANGNGVWAKKSGGASAAKGNAIKADNNGNVYVTGEFQLANVIFGSTTLTYAGIIDFFLVKYDTDGNIIWAKQAGGTGSEYGNSISLDITGNIYVTGSFENTITLGTTNLTTPQFFIAKYDGTGNVTWAKSTNQTGATGGGYTTTDGMGRVYVAGLIYNNNTVSFGLSTISNSDAFLAKICELSPTGQGTISGATSACAGQTGVVFSTSTVNDASIYNWVLPIGATITSGANSNTITVSFSPTATSGNITVQGINECGNGTVSANFPVTINPLPVAAGTITGTSTLCAGTNGISYTVPSITNATSYNWTLPSGASIVSGANTNTIIVNFSNNASTGNIAVRGTNTCGNGTLSPNYSLTIIPLPAANITPDGELSFCPGEDVMLTSSSNTGNSWNTGETTSSITVDSAGDYFVEVTVNGCSSISNPTHVTVFPTPTTPIITQVGADLISSLADSYFWFYNNNLINGATLQSYTPTQNGNYFVLIMDANGCVASSDTIAVTNIGIGEVNQNEFISVYPNPTTGVFFVKSLKNGFNKYEIVITDIYGKQIFTKKAESTTTDIDFTKYAQGIYYMKIKYENDELIYTFRIEKI